MLEIIIITILIISISGLGVILFRKMPDLAMLPETEGDYRKVLVSKIKEITKRIPVLKDFSYELYLQKILSKFRVLSMKTENKTGGWLERLRQKKNHENGNSHDKYWQELKKAKDGK